MRPVLEPFARCVAHLARLQLSILERGRAGAGDDHIEVAMNFGKVPAGARIQLQLVASDAHGRRSSIVTGFVVSRELGFRPGSEGMMAEDFRRFHFLNADITRGESVARHSSESAALHEVLDKVIRAYNMPIAGPPFTYKKLLFGWEQASISLPAAIAEAAVCFRVGTALVVSLRRRGTWSTTITALGTSGGRSS